VPEYYTLIEDRWQRDKNEAEKRLNGAVWTESGAVWNSWVKKMVTGMAYPRNQLIPPGLQQPLNVIYNGEMPHNGVGQDVCHKAQRLPPSRKRQADGQLDGILDPSTVCGFESKVVSTECYKDDALAVQIDLARSSYESLCKEVDARSLSSSDILNKTQSSPDVLNVAISIVKPFVSSHSGDLCASAEYPRSLTQKQCTEVFFGTAAICM